MIRVTRRSVRDRIKIIGETTEEVIEDIDQPTDFRQEPQHEIRENIASDVEDVEDDKEEKWQTAAAPEKNQEDIHHIL